MQKNQSAGTQMKAPSQGQKTDETSFLDLNNDLKEAVTINKTPATVFEFIGRLENYALFMKGIVEVKRLDETTFRWVFGDKTNKLLEWDTKVVQEIPGALIKWESTEGSAVKQSGTFAISRASGGRGTVVRMAMEDSVTQSQYGEIFEVMTNDEEPKVSARTNLRRLKSYLECGEIATTDGQPTGREAHAKTLKH